MEVTQSNPKAFDEFDLRLKELDGYETKVGWFDTAKYEDGTPVAYVASIQELGHGKIPARPFMRPAMVKNENSWCETAAIAAKRILDGKMTGRQGMDLIGAQAESDVSQAIADVYSPPLSLITLGVRKYRQMGIKITGAVIGEIARKLANGELNVSGVSTKPLNDTGHMIATLTHVTDQV